jgi:hypothetical protein
LHQMYWRYRVLRADPIRHRGRPEGGRVLCATLIQRTEGISGEFAQAPLTVASIKSG